MIGHLALEAEFRGVGIGELMTQLIVAAIEKDMFKAMLDENSGAEVLDLRTIRQNDPQQQLFSSIASLKPLSGAWLRCGSAVIRLRGDPSLSTAAASDRRGMANRHDRVRRQIKGARAAPLRR
jgi:hypothetical protein